jgi:hypothetical protein
MALNEEKLHQFLGRFVTDLGATTAARSVVIGHQLGLYKSLAAGPASAGELPERTRMPSEAFTDQLHQTLLA